VRFFGSSTSVLNGAACGTLGDRMGGESGARQRAEIADEVLRESGAILTGDHFAYVTGEHGDGWIDKDAIFPHTEWISRLAGLLAETVAGREAEIVCGPATGGLVVSQWTVHHLGISSVFCDHGKEQGYHPATAAPGPLRPPFVLKRGYDRLVKGRRVLVVDVS
jgi:orotate phosphoribosyltransferase